MPSPAPGLVHADDEPGNFITTFKDALLHHDFYNILLYYLFFPCPNDKYGLDPTPKES